MPPKSDSSFSYDQVPYSSYPYANSHPRNLAALAKLFGMDPPDVNRCRVLEIGCAAGGNLIPMAVNAPEATFLGIDASERQISEGNQVIAELPVQNIELHHQDVLDFDGDSGEFDYIICHGVYSWVEPLVQQKILALCRDHLSPQGVAYISYNTYPGWYLRRGVREMMHYHAEGFDGTQEKIDQARALVNFLAGAIETNSDAYGKLLHEELDILRSCEDSYLFHEHLEDFNEPIFFHQFAERAEKVDLRFLCEAQIGSMIPNEYTEETQQTLAKIAPNIIQMEQYLDFLRNRKFRQTLLCHRDTELVRAIDPSRVQPLFVSAPLTLRADDEIDTGESGRVFEHTCGQTVTVATPNQKAALEFLASLWPGDCSVDALAEMAWKRTPPDWRPSREQGRRELCETLLELYSSGLVSLHASSSGCTSSVSETPRTSQLVQFQATRGRHVTNHRHESVSLDELGRGVIARMDGCATIEQITDQLLESGITIEMESQAATTPSRENLRIAVTSSLSRLANAGLLIT